MARGKPVKVTDELVLRLTRHELQLLSVAKVNVDLPLNQLGAVGDISKGLTAKIQALLNGRVPDGG